MPRPAHSVPRLKYYVGHRKFTSFIFRMCYNHPRKLFAEAIEGGVSHMGLEKAIASGQEHRKPYHGAKAVCFNCRNHGTCDYCKGNRLHSTRKREAAADTQQREYNSYNCGGEDSTAVVFYESSLQKRKPVIRAVAQIAGLPAFTVCGGQMRRTRCSPRV